MNARQPMVGLVSADEDEAAQRSIEGAADLHFVWESRFGTITIDIVDGIAYVNGDRVEVQVDESSP
jgi:hypothetical protein